MRNIEFDVEGKRCTGIEVSLPEAPLVLAAGKLGFVMCGYLNTDAAEKLGVAAARVRGVSTIEDLLAAKIESFTGPAAKRGVKAGMTGKEALSCLV